MVKIKHLIPVRENFTEERYDEITQEDCHPIADEIIKSYDELYLGKGFDFICGDIINVSSIERDYNLYYFLARDGLELIINLGE